MFKDNRNLLIIALIAVVNALGYGIIIPLIYSYSVRFGLTDFQSGLLFAVFSACQFLATPIIGRLSDRYGRKPLLLISIGGTALSFFMMAWAPNWIFLFLARALDGITAGNLPVAQAVISDSTTPENRSQGFGIMGGAFGLGMVLGPLISALTVGLSTSLPFVIAGNISLVAVILTAFLLPETNKHIGQNSKSKLFDFKKMGMALFEPVIGRLFLITIIFGAAFGMFISVFQIFSTKVLLLQTSEISMVYMIFGAIGFSSQFLFVPRASRYLGPLKGYQIGIFFVSLGFLGMFLSRSLQIFICSAVIFSVFNALYQALNATILSLQTDPKSQGTVMGLNFSYMSVGTIIGPIIGGSLATIYTPYPFLAGMIATFICFIISLKIKDVGKHKEVI